MILPKSKMTKSNIATYKRAIYVYLTGGLGNQLFQYAHALSLDGAEQIKIDCKLGGPVSGITDLPALFDFNLNSKVEVVKAKSVNKQMQKIGFLALKLSVARAERQSLNLVYRFIRPVLSFFFSRYVGEKVKIDTSSGVGHFECDLHSNNSYQVGYFQSYKWAMTTGARDKLMELKLRNYSQNIIKFKELSEQEEPLVVHIRLGDYLNEKDFGILETSYYRRAIQFIETQTSFKRIWVFTNDPEMARAIFPEEYMVYVRWLPEIDQSSAATLEVMRFGHSYVIGNSTFSWWGAFLAYKASRPVVAPNPWFKSTSEPVDLCPPNWMRIDAWNHA